MEATAHWKYARVTPRRARMVANLIRGKSLPEAFEILQVVPRKACRFWKKVVDSAVANLKVAREGEVDPDVLYIKEIWADKGPVLKGWIPRAHGRATRIEHKMSHLSVVVAEK